MRILIIFVCLFSTIHTSEAQLLMGLMFAGRNKIDSDVVKMGVQVGGNISKFSNYSDGVSSLGLLLGFYSEIKLSSAWALHTGAFPITYMGVNDLPNYPLNDSNLDALLEDATLDKKLSYLGMPFLAVYQISPSWRLGLGPQIQLLLKANDKFYENNDKNELVFNRNIGDELRKIDYGISMHTGYYLRKGEGLYLQLRYYWGMRDVMKEISAKQANQSFQFILGIPIKGTDKESSKED